MSPSGSPIDEKAVRRAAEILIKCYGEVEALRRAVGLERLSSVGSFARAVREELDRRNEASPVEGGAQK